ncbi:Cytoplasmic dynein 2 heavy chain 1 [Apostichopus japonicus]|uniref:Cytoplasmic dynein 2 heavy chain 1 n=1 Tax=Stichopus japonicus TaxID=307972 RepID=A0A2G8JB15_STIJA|nr:Cytoplasmic dynein 2 heavy chain 1 [Apostichopus japonicus]
MKTSMDSLKFVCKWSGSVPNAKQQIKVGGLQLDGCTFDGSRLSENQRNSPSVCTVPTCNMAWVSQNSDDIYSSTDSISLPVYFSEDREKIVTNLKLPCLSSERDRWVQTGAALFLKNQ